MVGPSPRPNPDAALLAERDLVRARLPFFAVVWLGTSLLWSFDLATGPTGILTVTAVVALTIAELVILLPALLLVRRVAAPVWVRAVAIVVLVLLGLVWTVTASLTAMPAHVMAVVLPVLALLPPLFFAWPWQIDLGRMALTAVVAAAWLAIAPTGPSTALVGVAGTFLGCTALAAALAARVARELRIRISRRDQEEAAERALVESRQALLESEGQFRVAFQRAPIGMSMVAVGGRILQVNAAFERMLGRAAGDLVGRDIDDLIHPDYLVTARADRRRMAEGEVESFESVMHLQHRDGRLVYARVTRSLVRDRNGMPSHMIGQVEDVTERFRIENALRATERMFRTFTESMAAGVMITQDGVICYANAAVTALTGFDANELAVMKAGTLLHPEDHAALVASGKRVREEPVPVRVEYRLRTKSGTYRWVDLTIGIVEHEGRPALLFTAFDISERHAAEAALRASLDELRRREEQLRLLAQRQVRMREEERRRLGFDLHDDVCQELVGTGIMVEAVRSRVHALDPEASQKLARVGEHLNHLGEHLRLVAHELRPMVLHDLGLEESVRSLAAGMATTVQITTTFPTPIPRLGDEIEVAVYRIIQEALTNAIRHAEAREIAVSLTVSDGVLTVEVRDDGRGFDPKARDVAALGLVSMEERALAIGAGLHVSSVVGRGTSIVLTCPLIRRVPRPAA